jgi:hypothetical protein
MAMWTNPITVAETRTFVRQADDVWTDDEREAFVDFIARNPETGDIIRDGGGARVINFFHALDTPLDQLLVYAKAVRTDISPDAKKAVREFAERIKQSHQRPTGRRNR